MSEKNEEKEFTHFCDNPNCPNYDLELNDEKHYHDDHVIVGAICGILKTHPYKVKKVIPIVQTGYFMFRTTSHTVVEKTFHFCDICHGAIQFKEMNYD
jgi:hypothetical protein